VQSEVSATSISAKSVTRKELRATTIAAAALTIASGLLILISLALQLDLTAGYGVLLAVLLSTTIVMLLTPPLIRKMRAGGMIGDDVNKSPRVPVAELGGISALFAFSISLSAVVGVQKILGSVAEPPFLAAISVFFMAAMIGLIDDISNLRQRLKAIAVAFAALPLMLVHLGTSAIGLPLGLTWVFSGPWHLVYWLVLVPIGVTGFANSMNMSAGYNGLETGQITVISLSLLGVAWSLSAPNVSQLVFGTVMGCGIGLYVFNRYPAKVFIGDIGTLGLGAALAAGVILAHIEFYGVIAIAPAFYEMVATGYYGLKRRNTERKDACRHPIIAKDGSLSPPPGAGRYTLAYLILNVRPMTERNLVRTILALYALSGLAAVLLSVVQ
jgi:UDP-N-acetylglucosamine--dolichyl-phosphate N-acetylglucosaminephosphotransferase